MFYAWIENGVLVGTRDKNLVPGHVTYYTFDDVTTIEQLKIEDGRIIKKSEQELLTERKSEILTTLQMLAKEYIEQHYPEIKQRSDLADKEYYTAYLLAINQNYSIEDLYAQILRHVLDISSGKTTLAEIVTSYPEEERIAWEQLIKIALRIQFVQSVKAEYRRLVNQMEQAKTLAELENIDLSFKTKWPF